MKLKRLIILALTLMLLSAAVISVHAAGIGNVTMTSAQGHHTGNIIHWEAVSGAEFYQVYRLRSGETTWTLLKNTGSTGYKDTTAEVGVRCYYKVRARSGSSVSSMNIASVSAVRPLANVTMTGTTAHVTGNIVRWNSVEGAKLYQLYRRAADETSWTLITNTGSTAYKDTSAQVGIRYYYKVRARNGQLMSSLDIAAVSAVRPLANVTMTSAQGHETGIIVRWNAVEGAKLYQIYRLKSGETAWSLLKNTGSVAYKDTTAEEGQRYYYKVRARNGQLMSSLDIGSVSAVRPKKAASAAEVYKEFLKTESYIAPWDAQALPNLPDSYALVDIDGNGVEELILFGPATFAPWNNYMVFTCDIASKKVLPVTVSTGNDNYCYGDMWHSKAQKSLVFGCMSPMAGSFFREYYALSGTAAESIGFLGTERAGSRILYRVQLGNVDGYVSESEYGTYTGELTQIEFLPLP